MTLVSLLIFVFMTFLGTLVASVLACVPALHIYNVASIVILLLPALNSTFPFLSADPMYLMAFMLSLVVGYSIINTLPSIFLGAPDEASVFMVMPGQKYLMLGKGHDAAIISTVGGMGGALFLLFMFPVAPSLIPILQKLCQPHMGWMLALIIAYMIMSEFPKGGDIKACGFLRFLDAWKSVGAGMLAMLLSGIMGMILVYRPVINEKMAFQNLLPAFIGLFAIPWVLQNIMSITPIPKQHISESVDLDADLISRGIGSGALGGGFAALFPLVTGGIGGLLAGHATAQRDERIFVMSQGVSKFVYYVGAFFLFFIPNMNVTRGGMAWMLSTNFSPKGYYEYYASMGVILLSTAISFFLLLKYARWMIQLVEKYPYQRISFFTLIILILMIIFFTGAPGLLVGFASTGIGLIPVVFNSRRSNLMGVLLIPITLNMLGVGPALAKWMGLI